MGRKTNKKIFRKKNNGEKKKREIMNKMRWAHKKGKM
jgi:hypothetical protein